MVILQLQGIAKEYGVQRVLSDVVGLVDEKDKIGLVGSNGAGKTTLMKIVAGLLPPDKGQLTWVKGARLGYLEQQGEFAQDAELFTEVLSVFGDLLHLRERIRQLGKEMSREEVFTNQSQLEKKMDQYNQLMEEYHEANGYSCESQVRGVLRGLGFLEEQYEQKIKIMSGGQQRRVRLAKLLLTGADLILLDEPTNHLDLEAIEWLENYLKGFSGAVLIISHDRYFLNSITNKIWDLEYGKLSPYEGNYDQYIKKKQQRLVALEREHEKQQMQINKLEEYVQKNKAGVNAKQARGRQTMLDRMGKISKPVSGTKHMGLRFATQGGTGNVVRELKEVSMSYEDHVVFKGINLLIRKGERIGLVGPNGGGKTTLCRIITGQLSPSRGEVVLGYRVKVGYYSQTLEQLPLDKTIIQFIRESKPLSEEEARTHLGRFLFSSDDVFKTIGSLSGGEKSRVALAQLVLGEANFLVLDEPTNHLDIQAQEALELALNQFDGTLVTVSHDRYFLDRVTDKIIELSEGKLTTYLGNYTYYRKKKEQALLLLKQQQVEDKKRQTEKKIRERPKKQNQISPEQVEQQISALEQRLARLTDDLAAPETYADSQLVKQLGDQYKEVDEQLSQLYEIWEELLTQTP